MTDKEFSELLMRFAQALKLKSDDHTMELNELLAAMEYYEALFPSSTEEERFKRMLSVLYGYKGEQNDE